MSRFAGIRSHVHPSSIAVPQSELHRIETVFRDINQDTHGPAFLTCANLNQDVFGNFLPDRLAEVMPLSPSSHTKRSSLASLPNLHEFISIGHVVERLDLLSGTSLLQFRSRTVAA